MAEATFIRMHFDMCDNVDLAPAEQFLMCWGGGGWRFMRKDSVGQWRSIIGRPKPAPKLWGYPPEMVGP